MKDETKKYLIVDGSNIWPICNGLAIDSEGKYSMISYKGEQKVISDIFFKYGIPEIYQKIIIKLNARNLFFMKNLKAEVFLTNLPFIIKRNYYMGFEELIGKMDRLYPGCSFITGGNYSDYKEVIRFYYELRKNGMLRNYIFSLKEILKIDLNLDFLLNDEYFDINFLFKNDKIKSKSKKDNM